MVYILISIGAIAIVCLILCCCSKSQRRQANGAIHLNRDVVEGEEENLNHRDTILQGEPANADDGPPERPSLDVQNDEMGNPLYGSLVMRPSHGPQEEEKEGADEPADKADE